MSHFLTISFEFCIPKAYQLFQIHFFQVKSDIFVHLKIQFDSFLEFKLSI